VVKSDAGMQRTRSAILDAAARALGRRSDAAMAEIADEAGVGRATLYRHFPTREDLLAAIDARAHAETEAAFAASRLAEGTAGEALERLVTAVLEIGDRYRFLLAEEAVGRDRRRDERFEAPLFALLERGQAAGEFNRSMPPRWMLEVLGQVIVAAVREIAAGRLDRDEAPAIVTRSLLHGFSSV